MNDEGVIQLQVEDALAQYKDKYEEARLQWISAEMIKHIAAAGMLGTMSVNDYVEKMICLYEIKSHFP